MPVEIEPHRFGLFLGGQVIALGVGQFTRIENRQDVALFHRVAQILMNAGHHGVQPRHDMRYAIFMQADFAVELHHLMDFCGSHAGGFDARVFSGLFGNFRARFDLGVLPLMTFPLPLGVYFDLEGMRFGDGLVAQQISAGRTEPDVIHPLQPFKIDVQCDLIERNRLALCVRRVDTELRRHVALVNRNLQIQTVPRKEAPAVRSLDLTGAWRWRGGMPIDPVQSESRGGLHLQYHHGQHDAHRQDD